MADLKLNTTNGSVTLKPEDGSGNVDVTIPRTGVGKVLQVQDYVVPSINDAYTAISSGVQWDTPISISFTPASNNSKIYIDAEVQTRIIGAVGIIIGIKQNGVKIDGNYNKAAQYFAYKGDGINHHYQAHLTASIVNTNTTTKTFSVWMEPYAGTGEFSYGWGRNSIRIMEVAN